MNLLYCTDLHARGDNPKARLDSYQEAMWRKVSEVFDLSRQHRCKAILFGGDLTHLPDVSKSVERDLISLLRQSPCPIIGISGNSHDVWGGNADTLRRTALGVVEAAGCIQLIWPDDPAIVEEDGVTVQVSGQPFHPYLDRRDFRLDYCVLPANHRNVEGYEEYQHYRDPNVQWCIHMIHGMLRTRPLMNAPITVVQEVLKHTAADITLSGHDHGGFDPVWHEGRVACNPGALMRGAADEEHIERTVQALLLSFTPQTFTLDLIPLQSAAPGAEVLSRAHIEAEKAKIIAREAFMQGIQAGGDFKVLDLAGVVDRIATNKGTPDRIRALTMEYLTRAREQMAGGDDEEAA
ncbi:MAG: metallophosphoesterase [Dehalococcoidia bacterium]|nr:metallophosphoesterase [Dehalococcoidia bacterium]